MAETAASPPAAGTSGGDREEVLYRLRPDLVISQQGKFTVIKDPVRETYARLASAEFLVARAFDGESTLSEIRQRLQQTRRIRVSVEKLRVFRDRLHQLQLVRAGDEAVEQRKASLEELGAGLLGRIVAIPLPISFNPDRFLTWLHQRCGFVSLASFAALGMLVVLPAMQIWVQEWAQIQEETALLEVSGTTLLTVWLIAAVSVGVHEIGHGYATKVYGGEVRTMGVILYYFLIVIYADLSDAWLFRKRSQQIAVMAAGPWMTLMVLALVTIGWRLTIPGTTTHQLLLIAMGINASVSILTLIPLIRGDGYHMLSCAFDIPNLRDKAFRYTKARLARLFLDSATVVPTATPREARIFLGYAVMAFPFMMLVFYWAGSRLLPFFLGRLEAWGLLLLMALVGGRLRWGEKLGALWDGCLKRLLAAARQRAAEQERRSGVEETAKPISRWWIRAGERLRRVPRKYLLLGLAAAAMLLPAEIHVSGRFEIVAVTAPEVRSTVDGILTEVLVQAHDTVQRGEVLAHLQPVTGGGELQPLIAHTSGIVITTDQELSRQVGQFLSRGTTVLEIIDPSSLVARILVPEQEFGDVRTGQPVELRSYQFPAEELHGVVDWIEPVVERSSDRQTSVPVVCRPADAAGKLRPGTTGMAKIRGSKTVLGHIVYRRLLHSVFVRFWSWW